jgi:predicted phosphodiesterase
MDFVWQNQIPTVRGNHDDAWLAMCTFSDFGTPNHKFMRALPTWLAHEGLVLVHEDPALATDSSDDFLGSQGYINSQEQADRAFEAASVFADGPRVVAIGHTHIPSVFTNKGQLELQPRSPVLLPPDASCIINPGAVGGRPRSRWGNTYATYDTVKRELTIYKLNLPELDDPWEGFFRRIVS